MFKKIRHFFINVRHISELLISGKLFSEFINWHILLGDYLGLLRGERLIKMRNGLQFVLEAGTTDKWPLHEIIIRDEYRLKKHISECKTIFDIGANIGIFSIYAAFLNPEASIFAYEPVQRNYDLLQRNIEKNSFVYRVRPFPIACGGMDGQTRLFLSRSSRGGHSLMHAHRSIFVEVPIRTLETIFREQNVAVCDLLKIDIEGGEYDLLYHAAEGTYKKIRYISMEYHNLDAAKGQTGKHLQDFLEKQGFRVERRESIQHYVGSIFAKNGIYF